MAPLGRTLGRYELVKHLASGGMAEVVLARATGIEGFERYVVVKQIQPERSRDEAMVRMFLDEARLAASLHHASIVQVHDVGQDGGEYFIAMEYIHGENLNALLNRLHALDRQLPLDHAITIVSAVASALHYAHEQKGPDRAPLGLVHRDVSPSNILVGYDGNVKVVDFGIAKAAHRSAHTHSGTLKGKVSYMAPEQCKGHPVDRRSDVFALGIVLYELTTVCRLFKASTEFLTMSKIVSGNVPRPSRYRPELPAELERITLKALALDPRQRFQTADEMRTALDQFAIREGLRTSTTALGDYMIEMFGRKPEPWLVEPDEHSIVIESAFDGSGDGVVPAPEAIDDLPASVSAQPGSLLDQARRRDTVDAELAERAAAAGSGGGTLTSLGTTGQVSAPALVTPRRTWWIRGSALAVPVVVAALVIAGTAPTAPDGTASDGLPVRPATNPPIPAAASAPAAQEPQAPALPTASSAASPATDIRPLAAHAAQPRSSASGQSVPPSQASPGLARSPAAPSPSSGSDQTVAPSNAPGQAISSSSASSPAERPAVRSAGASRKKRGKTGKLENPIEDPPTTPAPPDKPETWNPDALFLKAPQ